MKLGIILQARLGSKRLPRKVLRKVNGTPIIEIMIKRLMKAKNNKNIIVAIPNNDENIDLENFLKSINKPISVFKGSENDVLDRFYQAAKFHKLDKIVRLTCDCPLIDASILDNVISKFHHENCDYLSNVLNGAYPDGMDIEVFSFRVLQKAFYDAKSIDEREHVTKYIYKSNKFKCRNFSEEIINIKRKISVDEKKDFELVEKVFNHFHPNIYFNFQDLLEYFTSEN